MSYNGFLQSCYYPNSHFMGVGVKVDDPMEHFVGTPAHKPCDEVGEAQGAIVESKNNYFLYIKIKFNRSDKYYQQQK